MPLSRRGFLSIVGAGRGRPASGAILAARGLEAYLAEAGAGRTVGTFVPPDDHEIRLSSNENPLGPGQVALDAIVNQFSEAGRYPVNGTPSDGDLVATIAAKYGVKPANLVLGAGSQEILKNAVLAYTSADRRLVTAAPTFENCTSTVKWLGHPLREIPVDAALRLDVGPMITAASGAGLVYFCNPNNPTATVHGAKTVADFVEQVRRTAPDTAILIDEAYHDYVTDPSYESAIPLALETPNVVVTRTFSKAYGMAGMRIGYGIGREETIGRLARLKLPNNISVLGVAAAVVSLEDPAHIEAERARNTEVRAFTAKALADLGCAPTGSETNFVFADIHRPAKEFRDACAKAGVMVGRDFPPFEKTHARISIGTMDEMQKAVDVFRTVLTTSSSAAARR